MLRSSACRTIAVARARKFHQLRPSSSPSSSYVEEFYTQLQKHGGKVETTLPTIRRGRVDASCVNEVLQSCSINDHLFLGLRFFIWAGAGTQSSYRHSNYMYSRACKLFKIDENPGVITDVFDVYEGQEYSVNAKTVKVVLNLCKEAKLGNEALWVLRKMSDFNVGPDTADYNTVIRLFAEKGDTDTAETLMQEMMGQGVYPNMVTFVVMIRGFCNVGRLEDACRVFKLMKEQGCVPNAVVVSALLDGISQFGNLQTAAMEEILSEMEKNYSPNVVAYTCIIQSFCNRGLAIKAIAVFDRMVERGCAPNTVTVTTLVDSLCKEGHVQEAYQLIDRMMIVSGGGFTSGKCYSCLVISLTRLNKVDDAVRLFRKMVTTSEMRPDSLACSVIIRELCSKGNYLDSFNLYCGVEKMGHIVSVDSDLFSILLAGLCRLHHTDEAIITARLMVCKGIRAVAPCDDYVFGFLRNWGEAELVDELSKINCQVT